MLASHRAHGERIAPDGRPVQVWVHQEYGDGDGRHEAARVAEEEGHVPARVVVEEDRVTRAAAVAVLRPDRFRPDR